MEITSARDIIELLSLTCNLLALITALFHTALSTEHHADIKKSHEQTARRVDVTLSTIRKERLLESDTTTDS